MQPSKLFLILSSISALTLPPFLQDYRKCIEQCKSQAKSILCATKTKTIEIANTVASVSKEYGCKYVKKIKEKAMSAVSHAYKIVTDKLSKKEVREEVVPKEEAEVDTVSENADEEYGDFDFEKFLKMLQEMQLKNQQEGDKEEYAEEGSEEVVKDTEEGEKVDEESVDEGFEEMADEAQEEIQEEDEVKTEL